MAKTESFRNYFIQEMQERKVTKKYIAISVGETIGSFEINIAKFNNIKLTHNTVFKKQTKTD